MPSKEVMRGKTVWRAQAQYNGKRMRRNFSTRKEAVDWEARMREQLRNPPEPSPKTSSVCLLEWANQYLRYAMRYTPKVRSEKKTVFKRFFKADGINPKMPIEQLEPRPILGYLQRRFQAVSGHAANKDRKNLRAAWAFGKRYLDFQGSNPFDAIDKFPHDEQGHYVPPIADFKQVLGLAEGQDKVLLTTFVFTAGRRGEVLGLRWQDIDFVNMRIGLKTRKTGDGSLRMDWIPLTQELAVVLDEHHFKHQDSEYVFAQPRGPFKGDPYKENRGFPQDLCRKAEVKPFGCHGIRGLTATMLAHHGIPLVEIQAILRHQRLTTTERYVRKMGVPIQGMNTIAQLVNGSPAEDVG